MTRNQPIALVYEVERTLYESSSTWEGIDAQEIPLSEGEVVLRIQPRFAAAMPLRFHLATVETSLVHAIEQVEAFVPWCLWVIGPSSQPSDLQHRFVALGFTVRMEWEGLTLDDLSLSLPTTAGLIIEPLCWDNAEAYATAIAGGTESPYRAELLSQAHRFLQMSPQEVQIDVARLDGEIAGFGVLRIEPNGVAYLRNAMTVPTLRNRGVYLSLVAYRLDVARTMGCTSAVLQAQTATSAPILIKRGFKPACRFVGLARKRPASTTSTKPVDASRVFLRAYAGSGRSTFLRVFRIYKRPCTSSDIFRSAYEQRTTDQRNAPPTCCCYRLPSQPAAASTLPRQGLY